MVIIKSLRRLADSLKKSVSREVNEDITVQEIYDFYAILGSLTDDFFKDEIDSFSSKIYSTFNSAVRRRTLSAFMQYPQPTKEDWINKGGPEKVWEDLNEISERFGFADDNAYDDLAKVADQFSEKEVDQIFNYVSKSGGFIVMRANGIWHNLWCTLKGLNKDLIGSNISKKILAIDHLLGMTHHAGSILERVGEKGAEQALNAKFNARTPADFWDEVSPSLRTQINKIRRSELQLPIITLNEERNPKIFTENPHDSKSL